jgi:hypothetical protein
VSRDSPGTLVDIWLEAQLPRIFANWFGGNSYRHEPGKKRQRSPIHLFLVSTRRTILNHADDFKPHIAHKSQTQLSPLHSPTKRQERSQSKTTKEKTQKNNTQQIPAYVTIDTPFIPPPSHPLLRIRRKKEKQLAV